jgi:hypothetical protein
MQFYFFHLMPWPHIPADFDERYHSAWVDLPNTYYDPEIGHRLYNDYLDELVHAETLGFDGVCVNEHHQNAYGTMPAPNIIASMLVPQTRRLKIALVGNGLPLRDHPMRVAEEVAMMDVISGGRIVSAFVRGIGAEYHSFSLNPTYSRERFQEAHDLIVRAWTEPGPFRFEGKHYRLRHVNLWPRPLQQPHPPIWIPSQGSAESIEWAAQMRYRRCATRWCWSTRRCRPSSCAWASTRKPRRPPATRRRPNSSAGWRPCTWPRPRRRRWPEPSNIFCGCSIAA